MNARKARLEAALLKVWYGGEKPAFAVRCVLGILELVYKSLRLLSQQDKKSRASKARTTPPLLVVGNLIAGGAGKTPIVMAVCQHVAARGGKVGIVSRGYGRATNTPLIVHPGQEQFSASEAGDEPLLLSRETNCPVAVCANRTEAVKLLLQRHPDLNLIVSDDGLQHHRLARQMEWVVFDERAHGNGRLLPAGPLREPLARLKSVDAVLCSNLRPQALGAVLNMAPQTNWHAVQVKLKGFTQLHTGHFLTIDDARESWKELHLLAFTGIGNPEKLFKAIQSAGLNAQNTLGLPDHFNYPDNFCAQFTEQVLITSGKDAVKLDPSNPKVWVAEIHVELPLALTEALEACIGPTID